MLGSRVLMIWPVFLHPWPKTQSAGFLPSLDIPVSAAASSLSPWPHCVLTEAPPDHPLAPPLLSPEPIFPQHSALYGIISCIHFFLYSFIHCPLLEGSWSQDLFAATTQYIFVEWTNNFLYRLWQGWLTFCKGQMANILDFACYSLFHNYSVVPRQCKRSHRQHIN